MARFKNMRPSTNVEDVRGIRQTFRPDPIASRQVNVPPPRESTGRGAGPGFVAQPLVPLQTVSPHPGWSMSRHVHEEFLPYAKKPLPKATVTVQRKK